MIDKPVDVSEVKPRITRRFCGDIDLFRKEEWKRRRLLRLEQVRQQSKDIASDIRRKVRMEKNALEDEVHKRNQIFAARWKEQKLTVLQNELTETLSNVGSGHKQAESEAKQEEEKHQLKALHLEAADRRGREAILRLRLDEAARRRADEAKKLQQQRVRSMEETRSAVVVSLPLPKSTVPPKKPLPILKTSATTSEKSSEQSVKQWPPKPWPVSVPLGVTSNINDSGGKISSDPKAGQAPENLKDKPIPHISKDTILPPAKARNEPSGQISANSSERPSSSKNGGMGVKRTSSTTSKQSKDIQTVELYDYINGSHVQYIKPPVVTKSIPAGPVDGVEAAEACAVDDKDRSLQSRELLAKRLERGKVALTRVQARREHRELLTDLAGLVRQQASLSAFLPVQVKEPRKVQAKLNEAVIDLLRPSSSTVILEGPVVSTVEREPRTETAVEKENVETVDHDVLDSMYKPSERTSPEEREHRDNVPVKLDRAEKIVDKKKQGKAEEVELITESAPPARESGIGELETVALDGETTIDSSVCSGVPKLNLALWSSRSPGSTAADLSDKTLTPSGDQRKVHLEKTSPPKSDVSSPIREQIQVDTPQGDQSDTETSQPTRVEVDRQERHRGDGDYHRYSFEMVDPALLRSEEKIPPKQKKPVPNVKSKVSKPKSPVLEPESRGTALRPSKVSPLHETENPTQSEMPAKSDRPQKREKVSKKKDSPSWSESTSYMSLPNKFLSALTDDIRSLLNLTLRRKATDPRWQQNPTLAHFINRLLDMSPESIDELNIAASEVSTPPSTIFKNTPVESSKRSSSLHDSRGLSSEVDGHSVGQSCLTTSRTDTSKMSDSGSAHVGNEALVNVMQQCHARITNLSEMIEKVRRDGSTSTPIGNRLSPMHLDSTAYYSPPPSVALPQMLRQTRANLEGENVLDETYSAVVSRLISEIRQQLAKEAEKPVKINLNDPDASKDKVESPNANDLSTIPEQDSSPLDWSSLRLRSNSSDSPDDVEKEFGRMGLGWAGATLRKAKEACTLDSNSSSDLLELSLFYGSYSHSTPIKTFDDKINISLGS